MKKIKNFLLISFSTYFKRITNLVVQIMLSAFFGTGKVMDSFFVAFAVPHFLISVLMLSSKNVLIPKLIEVEKKENRGNFQSELLLHIFILTVVISLIVILYSKQIISIIAPGFSEGLKSSSKDILIAGIGLIVLDGINHYLISIFNAREKYFHISLLPILSGIFTILLFYLLYNKFSVYGLLMAYYITSFFQVAVFFWILQREKIFTRLKLKIFTLSNDFKDTVIIAWPLVLSAIFINIVPVFEKYFASFLPEGSVSYLSFAERLNLAIMVIPFSLMTIFLPDMAKSVVAGKENIVKEKLQKNIISSLFLVIFITTFVFNNSETIVSLLLGQGKFDENSVLNTGIALKYYIGSVIGYNVVVMSANLLYSIKKSKVIAILYLSGSIFNILLAYFLSKSIGFKGIALAYSISQGLLSLIFVGYIQFKVLKFFDSLFLKNLMKVLVFFAVCIIFLDL